MQHKKNSCNGNMPFLIADTEKNYTVLNNYMGYTNCQHMFTQGQKRKSPQCFIFFLRPGLLNSKALTASTGILPKAACIPVATYGLSPYYGIEKS